MANSVCRLCRCNQNLQYMFDDNGRQNLGILRNIIFIASSVDIKATDIVSKAVCHRCCEIAVKLHKYRLNAVANDKLLKEQYGQPYVAPNINSSEVSSVATRSSCDLEYSDLHCLKSNSTSSVNDISPITASSTSLTKRTPNIKAKYKHPSVQNLHKQYKRIVLPEQVFSSHVSPVIILEKNAIDDWFKHQINTLLKRIPGIAIKKVTNSLDGSNSISTSGASSVSTSRLSDAKIKDHRKNRKISSGGDLNTGAVKKDMTHHKEREKKHKNVPQCSEKTKNSETDRSVNKLSHSSGKRKLPINNKTIPKKIRKASGPIVSDKIILPTASPTVGSSRKVLSSSSSEISFDGDLQHLNCKDTPLMAEAGKEREVYICSYCNKLYYTKKGLRHHEKTHLECKFCKEKFQDILSLNTHQNKKCLISIGKNPPIKSIEMAGTPDLTNSETCEKNNCSVELAPTSSQKNDSCEKDQTEVNLFRQENNITNSETKQNCKENENLVPIIVDHYSLSLEENNYELLEIEEDGSSGRCPTIDFGSSNKDHLVDSNEQENEVAKGKNVLKDNTDIIDITNDSDQELEHTECSRSAIIKQTEIEYDPLPKEPASTIHSIAPVLNEKEILRSLFEKHFCLPKNYENIVFSSDNSTQTTVVSDDNVKYSKNGVIIQDLYADLFTYKIPICIERSLTTNITFKMEEPNFESKQRESWYYKTPIGINKPNKETRAMQTVAYDRNSLSNNANKKYLVETACSTNSNCTNLKPTASVVAKNKGNSIAGTLATYVTFQAPIATASAGQSLLKNCRNSYCVQKPQQSNIITIPTATLTTSVVTTAQTPPQIFGKSYAQETQQCNIAVVSPSILTTVVATPQSPLKNYGNTHVQQPHITTVPIVPSNSIVVLNQNHTYKVLSHPITDTNVVQVKST